jgi:hypothetical protein
MIHLVSYENNNKTRRCGKYYRKKYTVGFNLQIPAVALLTNSENFPVEQELINLSIIQGLCFLRSKKWQLSKVINFPS